MRLFIILLLFVVIKSVDAQTFKFDSKLTKTKIDEYVMNHIAQFEGDTSLYKIAEAQSDQDKKILYKQYVDQEGYLIIDTDSVELVLGSQNIRCIKTHINKFKEESDYKLVGDNISLMKFLWFVPIDSGAESARIIQLRELCDNQAKKRENEIAARKMIWEVSPKKIELDSIKKGYIGAHKFMISNKSEKELNLIKVKTIGHSSEVIWPDHPIKPNSIDSIIVHIDLNTDYPSDYNSDPSEYKLGIYLKCDLDDAPILLDIIGTVEKEEENYSILDLGEKGQVEYRVLDDWIEPYIKIEVEGKIGLIDSSENIIIHPYVNGQIFMSSDYIHIIHNHLYGLCDLKGKELLPTIYSKIHLNNGEVYTESRNKSGDKTYNILDKQLDRLFNVELCKVVNTSTHYIYSVDCSKYSLISKYNYNTSDFEYSHLSNLYKNVYLASYDNVNYGLIDTLGMIVLPFEYEEIDDIYYLGGNTWNSRLDSLFIAKRDGKYGIIHQNGDKILDFKYDRIQDGIDRFPCSISGKWGILDVEGNIIVPIEYEEIKNSQTKVDRYVVKRDGNFGVVNSKNEVIVDFLYNDISVNDDGYFLVYQDCKWALLDQQAIPITDFTFTTAKWNRGNIEVTIENKWFVIDINLGCINHCPSDEFLKRFGPKRKDPADNKR